jgi:hypothetical protein
MLFWSVTNYPCKGRYFLEKMTAAQMVENIDDMEPEISLATVLKRATLDTIGDR